MDRISRREAVRQAFMGAAGTALAVRGLGAQPAATARAKSVVQVWMWGGPCHIDTFDPKPDAGYDFCGPLAKAIPTNVDGLQVGELLPQLAQQADKYSIIRGMTHGSNAHETASYMVQTGREPGRYVYPGAGAVVSLFRGYDHGYTGMIPPYVVLTELQGRFSEAGFLGPRHKPFATGGDPNQARFTVEGVVAPGLTDERQQSRRDLLHALDSLGRAMPGNASFAALDQCEAAAYDLIIGDARNLFDLNTESAATREAYGRNTFGQSCLMARRLVEAGMPYITINYKGWDTHKQHFETMRRRLPEMDKGLAMLLQDLAARGLLDSTIVWWSGEFGRQPRVSWEAPWNGGRQHWGRCFSALLAGGGFRGGHVVGASDAKGEEVADRPVYPLDLIGSVYELLGIDPEGRLPNPLGLETAVLPTPAEGAKSAGRLKEIMG
jgi:uncharacterized protein (DUF1501 family)